MDLETVKEALLKQLQTIPSLTINNLAKRVGENRKKVGFVLNFYTEDFQKKYRNPANVDGRKRPVWSVKKLTTESSE